MDTYEKKYKEALERANSFKTPELRDVAEYIFPELKESEDKRIKHEIKVILANTDLSQFALDYTFADMIAWLEKQDEQKPTQEIEPFEAEHGKYYYCIKDYFCGGRKQASKGDVVQASRGLPIMGLKDASEYFLPVNFIKCNSVWSEEDEKEYKYVLKFVDNILNNCGNKKDYEHCKRCYDWLKSLKQRYTWKPSDEQMKQLGWIAEQNKDNMIGKELISLYQDLKKLREE